jgi:hypothetical protein
MGVAQEVEDAGTGMGKEVGEVGSEGSKGAQAPMYTLQALWEGKMTLEDFVVPGAEKPSLPHNVFEQDEPLPVIDVAALLGADPAARQENITRMVDAAKSWGFFKIRNHGVPLEVVPTPPILVVPISKRLAPPGISYCII